MKKINNRKPISVIGETIPSNSKEIFEYSIKEKSEIRDITVNTHKGQEYDLQYTIEVLTERGTRKTILTDISNQDYIAGNGLVYDLDPRLQVKEDEQIRVIIENKDQNGNDYTSSILIEIDHETQTTAKVINAITDLL